MLYFDLKTLLTLIVVADVFSIILFVILLKNRLKYKNGIISFIAGRSLQIITWLTYATNFQNLEVAIMAITMVPMAFGMALETYSFTTVGKPFNRKKMLGLLSIALVFSAIYVLFAANLKIRVFVASSFLGLFSIIIAQHFLFGKKRSRIRITSGVLAFLLSVIYYIRAIYPLVSGNDIVIYNQSFANVLTGFTIASFSFVAPLLLLLLQKEKDDLELSHSNRMLQISNKENKKMVSIISHDLMSPIGSMVGMIDLSQQDFQNKRYENASQKLSIVSMSAIHGLEIIKNLLHWSVMQREKIEFNCEEINLNDRADDLILFFKPLTNQKNLQIVNLIPRHLHINSDSTMLETILRNLISNAIKFSNKGGKIEISAHVEEKNAIIKVRDFGIGMPDHVLKGILKESESISTNGTNNEKGTGFGLSLCKEIVEHHKGKLWASSQPNQGSTFYFMLPNNC